MSAYAYVVLFVILYFKFQYSIILFFSLQFITTLTLKNDKLGGLLFPDNCSHHV